MKRSGKQPFKQLIDQQLRVALSEIGLIKPWFDQQVNEWVFSHSMYPESCSGKTKQEVIRLYPKYIRQFIEQRFKGNLAPWVEKKTRGRGGKRIGAGRPKGTTKAPTGTVRLPLDIVEWICSDKSRVNKIRRLMKSKSA